MKNGLYDNLSNEDYHRNSTHISASKLKAALKSTAHFFSYKPMENNENFDIGNAFECKLLEPENYDKMVAVFDPMLKPEPGKTFASNANKAWKQEFYEKNAHKWILTPVQQSGIDSMIKSCEDNETIVRSLKDAQIQLSGFWTCPVTRMKLKTRPDVVVPISEDQVVIIDVKTSADGSPIGFAKQSANLHYPIQAATQIDGIESTMGVSVRNYLYLVVEKNPPYNATLYNLDFGTIKDARDAYQSALFRIRKYLKNIPSVPKSYCEFSSNDNGIVEMDIPAYYINQLQKITA